MVACKLELQWSRDLSTTEIDQLFFNNLPRTMLQWSRDLSTTEIKAATAELANFAQASMEP